MRKVLVLSVWCAISVSAWAGSITDPVTGLSWSFVSGGQGQDLTFATQRTDGFTLATSLQFNTLVTDVLGSAPRFASFPYNIVPPDFPDGFNALFAAVGQTQYAAESSFEDLTTASDSGVPGYVGAASLEKGYSGGSYFYSVGLAGGNTLFRGGNAIAPGPFAFALVTAVPEPSSWALMVGGLLAVAYRRRKRPM